MNFCACFVLHLATTFHSKIPQVLHGSLSAPFSVVCLLFLDSVVRLDFLSSVMQSNELEERQLSSLAVCH